MRPSHHAPRALLNCVPHPVLPAHLLLLGASALSPLAAQPLAGLEQALPCQADAPLAEAAPANALPALPLPQKPAKSGSPTTAQQTALGNVPAGYQFRLPTEAEWEYACRAGTTTEFHTGAGLFCSNAKFDYSYHSNSSCNSTGPAPVASYAANAWGLHDMHGNVWEWCLDSYAGYTAGAVTNPFVTGGPNRVARGASWSLDSSSCRSAHRSSDIPTDPDDDRGFRVVLAPILVP